MTNKKAVSKLNTTKTAKSFRGHIPMLEAHVKATRKKLIASLKKEKVSLAWWPDHHHRIVGALDDINSELCLGWLENSSGGLLMMASYRSEKLDKNIILSWHCYRPCASYDELAGLLLRLDDEGRQLEAQLGKS